jgi:hypothetical protein
MIRRGHRCSAKSRTGAENVPKRSGNEISDFKLSWHQAAGVNQRNRLCTEDNPPRLVHRSRCLRAAFGRPRRTSSIDNIASRDDDRCRWQDRSWRPAFAHENLRSTLQRLLARRVVHRVLVHSVLAPADFEKPTSFPLIKWPPCREPRFDDPIDVAHLDLRYVGGGVDRLAPSLDT